MVQKFGHTVSWGEAAPLLQHKIGGAVIKNLAVRLGTAGKTVDIPQLGKDLGQTIKMTNPSLEALQLGKLTAEKYWEDVQGTLAKLTGVMLTPEELQACWRQGYTTFNDFFPCLNAMIEFNKKENQRLVIVTQTTSMDADYYKAQFMENMPALEKITPKGIQPLCFNENGDVTEICGVPFLQSIVHGKTKLDLIREGQKLCVEKPKYPARLLASQSVELPDFYHVLGKNNISRDDAYTLLREKLDDEHKEIEDADRIQTIIVSSKEELLGVFTDPVASLELPHGLMRTSAM